MNAVELQLMFKDSGWDYTEAQYAAMASRLSNVDPFPPGAIYLEFKTAPTPDKLVNSIYNNKPKQLQTFCGKCEKGDISVAKLLDIPRDIEKAPIIYPTTRISCPFCQEKGWFKQYIQKAISFDKMPQVIAYLEVSERLDLLLPVILEIITKDQFKNYYDESRALWWRGYPSAAQLNQILGRLT